MTGPKNSVIGMNIVVSFKRFETTLPERYKIAEGECKFNAVMFLFSMLLILQSI